MTLCLCVLWPPGKMLGPVTGECPCVVSPGVTLTFWSMGVPPQIPGCLLPLVGQFWGWSHSHSKGRHRDCKQLAAEERSSWKLLLPYHTSPFFLCASCGTTTHPCSDPGLKICPRGNQRQATVLTYRKRNGGLLRLTLLLKYRWWLARKTLNQVCLLSLRYSASLRNGPSLFL